MQSSFFTNTEYFLVLLQSKQGDDGVRADTEVIGWETGPETCDAFSCHRNLETGSHIFVRYDALSICLLLLHLGLNVVEGERKECCEN